MSEFTQDGELQSDNFTDFSVVRNRLESFRGCGLAEQVPAERLAQAGFYFTGHGDRVKCFSCRETVENWQTGDAPVERHKQVSPCCIFLKCVHSNHFKPNGFLYEEESPENYPLRTGEVVDESTYPMAPHMRNEEARLQTFSSWPSNSPVRPQDLAEAGFYYTGVNDAVQCFCCAGMLSGWEPGDTAWGEHARHYNFCFFILGHDVGNVPTMEEDTRLESFSGVQHPIDHERLARAGFYSTGTGDRVLCFCCGEGLLGWQQDEDPWEEHALHYPGCPFLIEEKGQEFVNNIQLRGARQNRAVISVKTDVPSSSTELLHSALAREAIEKGLDPCVVEKTIKEKLRQTGSGYCSLEELLEDAIKNTPTSGATPLEDKDEDPVEKLRELQREKQCKICMDRDVSVVFIPCGHLVSCDSCSKSLVKCPICCGAISQKIKTYIS
uniref:E3 ubiquitin-protein ligase XIAP n=1 Tax=Cynoglossus semilaevis TaxID=244447 RepID=A0A3P8X072_CYNSE